MVRRLFVLCFVLVGTALYSNALLPGIAMPSALSLSAAAVASGPDNRYCAAPRTPQFGATADGPATLPTKCINTALSSTPSPGATWSVCASGCAYTKLQDALNAAACGDTIELRAGETFSSGKITFPARNCDDAHWITVRTSTADSLLPPQGTRMTPCWAAVRSLPDRPAFDCPSTVPAKSLLARIVITPGMGSIFIRGDHYRLIGLEVTRAVGGGVVSFLFNMGAGSNVVFDRMWFHGTTRDELTHGVMLSDSHHVAVIDSYFNDFKCIAKTGACSDAQTVSGGNDSTTGFAGGYKIVNNFLEAAGENILFGGGPSADTPGDYEIRRNHLYKPMSWNPASSTFGGIRWVVKNHLEFKNATRVLVEGNVFENIWGGFSQFGAHVLLNPRNQAQGWKNLCPICSVTQITIRYNRFITGGQVFQIANGKNGNGAYAKDGRNYSIHDNVAENISYRGCYGCTNQYNQLFTGLDAPLTSTLSNVSIAHNTFVVSTAVENNPILNAGFLGVGGPRSRLQPNISITNNIFAGGYYGPWSTGLTTNCAYNRIGPLAKFQGCWSNWKFEGNVVSGGLDIHQAPIWPASNSFPANQAAIGYVNLSNGLGGDYRLATSSMFKTAGTTTTAPGADVTTLNTMTSGVR